MHCLKMLYLVGLCYALSTSTLRAEWETVGQINTARGEATAVIHEQSLFVFNGFTHGIDIATQIERIDLDTLQSVVVGSTTVASSTPTAVTHAGHVQNGNELWFIGGRIGDHPGYVSDRIWIYNLDTYQWREGPRLPEPFGGGGAARIGNEIHVFGGFDASARCDIGTHHVYDLTQPHQGWQTLPSAMPKARNHFATAVVDGVIYAVGGQHGHDACAQYALQKVQLRDVHAFYPTERRWERRADLPTVQSHVEPSTFVHGNRIFTVGGFGTGKQVLSYDPNDDRWQQHKDLELPEALLAPIARVYDGYLYVFGGGAPSAGKPTDSVRRVKMTTLQGDNAEAAVLRFNVGGPDLIDTGGHTWHADEAFSQYLTGETRLYAQSGDIPLNKLASPLTPPEALFNTTRYAIADEDFSWSLPVAAGRYAVSLYFAELYPGTFDPDQRVFDIRIEGRLEAATIDIAAEAGPRTAMVKRFEVDSDNMLDIVLKRGTQNPSLNGIAIVPLPLSEAEGGNGSGGGADKTDSGSSGDTGDGSDSDNAEQSGGGDASTGQLEFSELEVVFDTKGAGTTQTRSVQLRNLGSTSVTVGEIKLQGSDAHAFTTSLQEGLELLAGESQVFTIGFHPPRVGHYAAVISINDDSAHALTLLYVEGQATHGDDGLMLGTQRIVYRLNAGGGDILADDGGIWHGDVQALPIGITASDAQSYASAEPISDLDAALPPALPLELFSTERWSADDRQPMSWSFDVVPGQYEVRLYFAEIYAPLFAAGKRVFDVLIEGELVINALDVFAATGASSGLMKSLVVDSDARLNVELRRIVQNPALKAVEIRECLVDCR